MRTPDGWSVEVINLDGQNWYRVKRYGSLALTGGPTKRRGLVRTIEEVEQLLGESFAQLS